jgi:glycosyltransferase involved in cell wall biosynthesis
MRADEISAGFFWDNSRLGRSWVFGDKDAAFSGTDGILLHVANAFCKYTQQPVLWVTALPAVPNSRVRVVSGLDDALLDAAKNGIKRLVVVVDSSAIQKKILQSRFLPCSIIGWAHCTPDNEFLNLAYRNSAFEKLVAVSHRQSHEWAHHPIFGKTVVIPNFVDVSYWSNATVRQLKRIIYVGALRESKGFHRFAEIWPAVHQKYPDWQLDVCGSSGLYGVANDMGPYGLSDPRYEAMILGPLGGSLASARSLGVNFLGSVAKPKLKERFEYAAFALVNPNPAACYGNETFCVSAVEALASGIPVVGGASGGLFETVGHAIGGLLAKNNSELYNAVEMLIRDDKLRQELAARGRKRILDRFNPDNAIDRWLMLLNTGGITVQLSWVNDGKYLGFFLRRLWAWVMPIYLIKPLKAVRNFILK